MELRRKLWDGLLPIKIDLAMSDLNSLEPPRSLYVRFHIKYFLLLVDGTKRKLFFLDLIRSKINV